MLFQNVVKRNTDAMCRRNPLQTKSIRRHELRLQSGEQRGQILDGDNDKEPMDEVFRPEAIRDRRRPPPTSLTEKFMNPKTLIFHFLILRSFARGAKELHSEDEDLIATTPPEYHQSLRRFGR